MLKQKLFSSVKLLSVIGLVTLLTSCVSSDNLRQSSLVPDNGTTNLVASNQGDK